MNLQKIYPLVLVLLFSFLLSFGYLNRFHDQKLAELNKEAYPSNLGGGFTLFNVKKVVNLVDKDMKSGVMIALKPGEEFRGILGLKNHESIDHTYAIDKKSFIKVDEKEEEGEGDESVMPSIELESDAFMLGPDEVSFFDYVVRVPAGVKSGEYRTKVSMVVSDPTAQKIVKSGLILDLAIGVSINLIVDESPPYYEYELSYDQVRDVAMDLTMLRLRYILTFFLVLVTVYFAYKSYKSK